VQCTSVGRKVCILYCETTACRLLYWCQQSQITTPSHGSSTDTTMPGPQVEARVSDLQPCQHMQWMDPARHATLHAAAIQQSRAPTVPKLQCTAQQARHTAQLKPPSDLTCRQRPTSWRRHHRAVHQDTNPLSPYKPWLILLPAHRSRVQA
jgi:hypothetical protein